MNSYFIENISPVDQPVGPLKGPHKTIQPSQHLILEAKEDDVKWMFASSGLRVTKRKPEPEAKADDAPPEAPAAPAIDKPEPAPAPTRKSPAPKG